MTAGAGAIVGGVAGAVGGEQSARRLAEQAYEAYLAEDVRRLAYTIQQVIRGMRPAALPGPGGALTTDATPDISVVPAVGYKPGAWKWPEPVKKQWAEPVRPQDIRR